MSITKTKSTGAAKVVMTAMIAVLLASVGVSAQDDEHFSWTPDDNDDISHITPMSSEVRKVVGLTVLVRFPDQPPPLVSREAIEEMLNRQGGYQGTDSEGSVRDFYLDVSGGLLDYTNIVTPWITISKARSSYAGAGWEERVEIIHDALGRLRDMNFDISGVTTREVGSGGNSRREVVAFNVIHSVAEWGGGMASSYRGAGGQPPVTINGVSFRRYSWQGVGGRPRPPGIYLFAHESGHSLLSWPDVVEGDGTSAEYMGRWCLMGGQLVQPNPLFRHRAGWVNVIDITDMRDTVLTIAANGNIVYRYARNNKESYYIEARRRVGRSANLPGEGLVIWHVHEDGDNSYGGVGRDLPLIGVVKADNGASDWTFRGNPRAPGSGAPFRADGGSGNTTFNSATRPAARYHDGTASNLNISEVSALGDTMTFRVGRPRGEPITYHLTVENGNGSGYYAPNTRVNISASATNAAGRYFYEWTSDDFDIDNVYSRETFVTTGNRRAMISARYTPHKHLLPGRVEADAAAHMDGMSSHRWANIGATNDRILMARHPNGAMYAHYMVDVEEDGEYQLSYRFVETNNNSGHAVLRDMTNNVILDMVTAPRAHAITMRTITSRTVRLSKGAAVWRLEVPPGASMRMDWFDVRNANAAADANFLRVANGSGSGYYAPGARANISAPAVNSAGEYFFRWTSDDPTVTPSNVYSRETFVTMGQAPLTVAAQYTANKHALPGRIEADAVAFWAGLRVTAHSDVVNAGATDGRTAWVENSDTTQHALYVVDIAEDGAYQLSYSLVVGNGFYGTLYLIDAVTGVRLDEIKVPTSTVQEMRLIVGNVVTLRKGAGVLRLEATPRTRVNFDWIGVERAGAAR